MRILLGLFLIISVASASPLKQSNSYTVSAVVPAAYSNFKTLTTEHFNIHYPARSNEDFFIGKNMEMMARLAAVYFEEGFQRLTKDLNSRPYLRIQVVIVDNTDSHNGFATPVPQNTIYIYAVPPLGHTSVAEYDNWLRETAFHELTHIINLSTTRGYSSVLRPIFGTIVDMNGLSPLNFTEGYAVFEETNMTHRGRGRSTFLHTMLRTTAYEKTLNSDTLYSLSRAPYILDKWPVGEVPYLYGYLLFEHVAEKYGLDVPGKISRHNAGVVPYYPSYSFENFTGKGVPELWDDMLAAKREFYAKWVSHISKSGITKIFSKTNEGFINRTPALSPDGKFMAFYVMDPNRNTRISIIDVATNKEINHIRANDASFIKWLDNETIIFNNELVEVGSDYYYVETLNVKNDILSNDISNSKRVLYADVIEGNELCTVRARTGRMDLNLEALKNNKLSNLKTLYSSNYMGRLSNPVCFKKGTGYEFYFIEKELDKDEQIVKMDTLGSKAVLYRSPGNIKGFTIDHDKITFIDDSDGVFNLYRTSSTSSGKVEKKTNLISGAFDLEPVNRSNSDSFYITYYMSDGFRIGEVQTTTGDQKGTEKFKTDDIPIRDDQKKEIPEIERKTYTGFKTLVPKLWLPSFSFVDGGYTFGGMTYGSDALFRHQYFLSGEYDTRTKKPVLNATYTNQSFYPIYSVSMNNNNTWFSDSEIIRELQASVDIAIPINTYIYILTGLDYDYRNLDFLDIRTKRYGIYGGIGYSDTATTLSAISAPEQGVSGYLKYALYPQSMDSTYHEYEIDAVTRFYIPMWWDGHVIAINNDYSYSYGNPYMFFVAGGEQSSLIFNSKSFLMRGYPVSYFSTQSLMISNIEYRFPIFKANSG